jgi:hypothetical protein
MIASNRHFAVVLVIGILIGLVISQLSTFFVSLKQPQRPQVVTKYQDVMPLIDVFPNEMYRTKSTPLVLTGGSVSKGRKWLSIEGKECFSAFCPPDVPNQKVVQIEGDAIAVYISHHYFHFVYESMLQMYPLLLHGIFERYPNATILCFGEGVPNQLNFEMMKALKFDLPRDKMMMARTNTVYKIGAESTLIVTRHNNYHSKKEFLPYNFWLLETVCFCPEKATGVALSVKTNYLHRFSYQSPACNAFSQTILQSRSKQSCLHRQSSSSLRMVPAL